MDFKLNFMQKYDSLNLMCQKKYLLFPDTYGSGYARKAVFKKGDIKTKG